MRGVALAIAHDRYTPGPTMEKLRPANERTTLFAQIETKAGVENAEAIAALDGVDCLWVGHFDLSCSLGVPGQFDHPDVHGRDQPGDRGRAQARQGRRPPRARRRRPGIDLYRQGFDFVCYSGDVWVLQAGVQGRGSTRSAPASSAEGAGAMDKFRVALSADFLKEDGSPAYPMFDLWRRCSCRPAGRAAARPARGRRHPGGRARGRATR